MTIVRGRAPRQRFALYKRTEKEHKKIINGIREFRMQDMMQDVASLLSLASFLATLSLFIGYF